MQIVFLFHTGMLVDQLLIEFGQHRFQMWRSQHQIDFLNVKLARDSREWFTPARLKPGIIWSQKIMKLFVGIRSVWIHRLNFKGWLSIYSNNALTYFTYCFLFLNRWKQKHMRDSCLLNIIEISAESESFLTFKETYQESQRKRFFTLRLTAWINRRPFFLTTWMLQKILIKIFCLIFISLQ